MFLEISQNSQENTCFRDSFLAQLFSYEICEISKNTFFTEHLQMTASGRVYKCNYRGCHVNYYEQIINDILNVGICKCLVISIVKKLKLISLR